jgi:precorrin-2 dehydrogenase / sirohydrochlorin ferrochelatase
LLIDLKLEGKTIIVVGGGTEAYRKTGSFVDSGATIWVISKEFSDGIQRLANTKKIALVKTEIKNAQTFVGNLNPKPDLLFAVTNNSVLNLELIKAAKKFDCMVYSVDNPALSDFIIPAVAHIGEVKVAISTSGKSPAMARLLRERIEKLVTPEDLLEIELQSKMRDILKKQVADSKERGKLLYEILNNNKIKHALKQGNLVEAQELAIKLINKTETEK